MKDFFNLLLIPLEYFVDFARAIKWSKASPFCPPKYKYYYEIILLAHTVEKGLSVENPRNKFGIVKITKLIEFLDRYDESWDVFPVEKSYGCLKRYIEWHKEVGFDLGDFGAKISIFLEKCEKRNLTPKGGIKLIKVDAAEPNSYEAGLLSRYSARRYQHKKVDKEILARIGAIALRAPSQCNRQSGRIHYYSDRDMIDQLLRLQAGAEGFREDVYNLLVISSEISAWSGFKARSQAYVDGSLLAMQVINACQALGLAVCPLNLAVSNFKELKICKVGNIPANQRLIMMISFGYSDNSDFVVARSERIQLNKLVNIH